MDHLLLFDIDGTLINSGGAGGRALDRACAELHGIPKACSLLRLDGMTDRAIVREIFRLHYGNQYPSALRAGEAQAIDETLDKYLEYLAEEVKQSEKYHVLPGIMPLISTLHELGNFCIGLATGNVKKGAMIKLDRANLSKAFSFGGFGCDSEIRSELVFAGYERACAHAGKKFLPENTYIIGDTQHDIEAGKKLGFQTVAVCTGSFDSEHLANYKPNFSFGDFSSVENFLKIFSS